MFLPVLWVTQDHPFGANVLHHGGADCTGEGALCLLVAILQVLTLNDLKMSKIGYNRYNNDFWVKYSHVIQRGAAG